MEHQERRVGRNPNLIGTGMPRKPFTKIEYLDAKIKCISVFTPMKLVRIAKCRGIDTEKCAVFKDFKTACQHGLNVIELGNSNESYSYHVIEIYDDNTISTVLWTIGTTFRPVSNNISGKVTNCQNDKQEIWLLIEKDIGSMDMIHDQFILFSSHERLETACRNYLEIIPKELEPESPITFEKICKVLEDQGYFTLEKVKLS